MDHLKFSGAVKMSVCCLPVTTALANERCRNFTFLFAREETEAQGGPSNLPKVVQLSCHMCSPGQDPGELAQKCSLSTDVAAWMVCVAYRSRPILYLDLGVQSFNSFIALFWKISNIHECRRTEIMKARPGSHSPAHIQIPATTSSFGICPVLASVWGKPSITFIYGYL